MKERYLEHWPKYLPRDISLPEGSLWQNVELSTARFPRKPCYIFYDTAISYADFKREAESLAGFLQRECGVKRGDRVALFMHNSPQFAIAYYAILRADAMVVPINPMYLGTELALILEDCSAKVIFAPQDLFQHVEPQLGKAIQHAIVACYSDYVSAPASTDVPPMMSAARQKLGGAGVTLWSDALARAIAPAAHLATADDLCVLPYTSGTTGQPKGCIHRHRSVMHTAVSSALWHRLNYEDRGLAALPMFHVTGMQNSVNLNLYVGSSSVILPRWSRDAALRLIARHRISRLAAVPTMIVDLLSSPDLGQFDLSSMRGLAGGGAAMPQAVAEKMHAVFGLDYLEGYGLSETMAPSHINPDHRPKRQCLGIPIFNTDARVVDPETLAERPPGEVGEIIVHGPQVFEGYWNDPETTARSFVEVDGKRFLRTGDLGRTDDDGYFFFVDRIKRMINAAGFKVWPAEVEALLHAHPAVKEAVVISKRDSRSGETVKALVVPKDNLPSPLQEAAVIEWARTQMAAYKVPREVQIVTALPRAATGKVDWRSLQERENARA